VVSAVFFGSSDSAFSNRHFDALLRTGCRVAAVVDVPPARRVSTNASRAEGPGFAQAARQAGIACFEPARAGDPAFLEALRGLGPDLFVAVGYMLVLPAEALAIPRVIAANFHASLLPAYRGKHPVFRALRAGEPECGLTVHEIAAGIDTGDIIFQVRVPVLDTDGVASLYGRIMDASLPLVGELVAAAERGRVPRRPQGSEGSSYFGATTEEDFRVSWSMDAPEIVRWVRATPGQCFVQAAGAKVFLMDAAARPGAPGATPGTVLGAGPGVCRMACGHGSVEIARVRVQDGSEMSAREAFGGPVAATEAPDGNRSILEAHG
jgi:methionyl-tRNA formyltransferase